MERETSFKRILLATDGSSQADAAVDSTIQLAQIDGATVLVLHIWNLEVHHRHGVWDVEVHGDAARLVQGTVDRLRSAGVAADKEIYRADNDHIAAAIALTARGFTADLVVVGSRGLSDWQSIWNHSVSHRVLAALDCPVLVVRSRPAGALGGAGRILLAVAGGDDVAPAVKAASAVARSRDCTIRVVHVAQAIIAPQGFAYIESDDEIHATVQDAIKRLGEDGLPAEGLVLRSAPVAKAVADAAADWNADLIVIGSSRMGDVAGLLLGSVSHDLLHSTEVPVLIAERTKP